MKNIVGGYKFLELLAKALGLEGQPIQRIVIVADVEEHGQVYVKGLINEDKAAKLAEILPGLMVVEDVQIADDCSVIVTKKEEPSVPELAAVIFP